MTTETAPTSTADERVRQIGLVTRLLTRPEFGAIVATVVVWAFFAIAAADNNFVSWTTTAAILNRAAPLGLLAIAVALLMIGGVSWYLVWRYPRPRDASADLETGAA